MTLAELRRGILVSVLGFVSLVLAFGVGQRLQENFVKPPAVSKAFLSPPTVPVQNPPENLIQAKTPGFIANLQKAVVPLYLRDAGSVRFDCTATAIQKLPTGYVFLTARHCVEDLNKSSYFVVIDPKADTPYIRAVLLAAGGADTDAAILQVNTPLEIPVIPLGSDKAIDLGSEVEYIGYPMDLGSLYFEARLRRKTLTRPPGSPRRAGITI